MTKYGSFVDGEDDFVWIEAASVEEALDITEEQCHAGAGWRVPKIAIGVIAPDGKKFYREIEVDVEEVT